MNLDVYRHHEDHMLHKNEMLLITGWVWNDRIQ